MGILFKVKLSVILFSEYCERDVRPYIFFSLVFSKYPLVFSTHPCHDAEFVVWKI